MVLEELLIICAFRAGSDSHHAGCHTQITLVNDKLIPVQSHKCWLFFTYRNEDVQEVLQSGKLRDELLHHFAEGLKDGVIVNTRQVKAE